MFYSKRTKGFYTQEIHTTMPDDVVEITEDEHKHLLKKQMEGFSIEADENGKPIFTERKKQEVIAQTSRQNFCLNAEKLKILTEEEAIEAAVGGWPAKFSGIFKGKKLEEIIEARSLWMNTKFVRRDSVLLNQLLDFYADLTGFDKEKISFIGDQLVK